MPANAFGITPEHAKRIDFTLAYNEHIRKNVVIDFAFLEGQKELLAGTKGPHIHLNGAVPD